MTAIHLGDVSYEATVSGSGPPVVFLHGFSGSATDWAPFTAAISASRTAVAIDLLGHGSSSRPADPARYALERQSVDLAAAVEQLGLGHVGVVGYSYGARIALQFAIDHPEQVTGLALESPSAGIADPAERQRRRASDEALADDLERDGIDAFARRWGDRPVFASERRLPDAVRRDLEDRRRANDAAALAAALRGAGQGAMTPLHADLARIAVPAAILAGSLDETGLTRARIVTSGIPGATLEVLDGVGHAPHREAPGSFAAWLATALDRIDALVAVPSSPHRRSP
ncbi:MAG: alpha/beta fold hydrolase [Chloroflexota bacterium]